MGEVNFIKSIITKGIVSEQDALSAILEQIDNISLQDYFYLVLECKKNRVDASSFFKSIYMHVPEDVQYQMWKDGYVESCPAHFLIADIASEKANIMQLINLDYDAKLPLCKAYFENIQEIIIKYISNAKKSIKIAMAWFTNPIIFNNLLRICKRGIEVDLLINNDLINNRSNGLPFDKLIQAGANLYLAEPPTFIHNKFCIIDNQIIIDGSYNWTILAEKNNDENIVVIEHGNVIEAFIDAFDRLIRRYRSVDTMPVSVPKRPEFDSCSYQYYNSEEWLEQINETENKKKQYKLYKEIYKILPKETAKEKLPLEVFESVKNEVEAELKRDESLFDDSITKKSKELENVLLANEKRRVSVFQKIENISQQRFCVMEKQKKKIETIKTKRISQEQKTLQINKIRQTFRTELSKLSNSLKRHNNELNSLQIKSEKIGIQKDFIDAIRDTNLEGANGLCRINLKWNTADDLDLHLILPDGSIDSDQDIYYSHMYAEYNGGVCSLDHDAIPTHAGEYPQENIIWEQCLPDGQYRVVVKLFNKNSSLDSIPFSVTAFAGKYVKTEIFHFHNAVKIIDVATLTFKNGKVVTPILFNQTD